MKIIEIIFEIEGKDKMWVSPWEGDPPRTLKIENAKTFKSEKSALKHIDKIKLTHPFRKVKYKVKNK